MTGGAGFLGSHLAEAHLKRGDKVIIVDLISKENDYKIAHLLNNKNLKMYRGSITDKDLIDKVVWECDLCYHFAALVGVQHYVANPHDVIDVNVNGTMLVMNLAYKYEKKMVFASTSEVYGRSLDIPFSEDGDRVLGPTKIDRWCYSTSKAIGEHYAFALAQKGLRMVILRFFNVYGPRLDSIESGRVASIFIGQLLRNKPLTVIGDGAQTRCYTYIDDAIRGIIMAAENPAAEGEVLNLGTDVETSVMELARLLVGLYGKGEIVSITHEEMYGLSYEDIPRRVPDVSKAKKLLGFEATTPIHEGMKKTLDWFIRYFESHEKHV
ncbi:GDP-mannose 4,6-dehydratase [bacterium]|nr:GDP-mannose 4,6-dehydratase [bacterium]